MLQQLKAASQQVLVGSVLEPNPKYRTAVGVLGVALPPVLLVWAMDQGVQSSISAYYYTAGRDWFVGTLCVIGVFLIFYQYRPLHPELAKSHRPTIRSGRADAYLGKCAGVAAVLVALLPTTPPAGLTQPPIIGAAHGAAAFVMFASLSLFPLLLFSQSSEKAGLYRLCGWLMLTCLALIGVYALSREALRQALVPWRPVLLFEWA
ncbi:MAG: hypothetical protein HYS05_03015, partial [Acidobacteria bacterium]|nr:hypothetical protein [Acidobacteriota bacterium]